MSRLFAIGAATVITAVLAACATGPAYVRPTADVPPNFKEGASGAPQQPAPPDGWKSVLPQDARDRGAWWEVYGDAQLNELESHVSISNQTIERAVAMLKESRAAVGVARSAYFPNVDAAAAANRSHTSLNVAGNRSLAGRTVSDYSAGVSATWEPDLFDKIGHSVDAATARSQASEADLASVELAMHAELAVDYFSLHELDAEAKLLQQTIEAYQAALDLVQVRFDKGVASDLELAQAQAQLQTARSQLIDTGVLRAAFEHAIATLTGQPASTFALAPGPTQLAPPQIPTGVPSALLERRPDVAAAERRVLASNADIGAATSAFFPDLILSATRGFQSDGVGNWLTLPSRFWAIGPTLVGNLFDGGRRKQQLAAAQARYDAAVADYRQAVLTSFQNVEDNLASLRILADEAQAQQAGVGASQRALDLILKRYKGGAVGYLDVVTEQTIALSNERVATQIAGRRLEASVQLVKALGGLWNGLDPQPQAAALPARNQ